MGIFYTGKGDKGKSIIGKRKVDKTCLEISALGDLDELNCLLGAVRNEKLLPYHKKVISEVQENLFIIQANVAGATLFYGEHKSPDFPAGKITEIEKIIDGLEREIKPAKKFVIPGETRESAWLDVARTVSRRVEREVLKVHKKRPLPPTIPAYLNRLSSLLFALARAEAKRVGKKERHPRYK
ncbi:MAG: cob(I)yrinic acid a,c-diamide adenosyltransferase [Candidatus Jorgensenbacteria bacterium]|nr:cob(I)yrinic acid a,c-diamide adenosyltransferase [Candidatus Jorgensenbacteria bacterium]